MLNGAICANSFEALPDLMGMRWLIGLSCAKIALANRVGDRAY
jgi:hypothetical protein